MPLLTITNLTTSPITIQDPTGLSGLSLLVPGSGAITNKAVTEDALVAIEAQLNTEQTMGNLRWSAKDDPTDVADSVPGPPSLIDRSTFAVLEDDFMLAAGATVALPLAKAVQGSATGDFLANTAGGVYQLATAAVSEAEAGQLTAGDQLLIDPTKAPIFEARISFSPAGAAPLVNERWVVGLCSAHATAQASLDATVYSCWFRGQDASLKIYVEADDNVHDTNLLDSGFVYVKNTMMLLKIDMTDITKVKMYVNGVQFGTTLNMSSIVGANLLQPIFCQQRDAGTTINLLKVDWYRCFYQRT